MVMMTKAYRLVAIFFTLIMAEQPPSPSTVQLETIMHDNDEIGYLSDTYAHKTSPRFIVNIMNAEIVVARSGSNSFLGKKIR